MRWKMVGAVLVGSVVVAAACASSNERTHRNGTDVGVLDALADALGLDHVASDALAAENPTIDEISCAKVASGDWYASKAFPGRSRADLARGSALRCYTKVDADGFGCHQYGMDVKDGAVRVICGADGSVLPIAVTIVMPPSL